MAERTTEISFELPASETFVLDGYAQASKISRTKIMRQILREWSMQKHHESILICRVAGVNPDDSGTTRHDTTPTT